MTTTTETTTTTNTNTTATDESKTKTPTTESTTAASDGGQAETIKKDEEVKKESADEDGKEKTDETKDSASSSPAKKAGMTKSTPHKMDYENDVVYLYQFGRSPTIVSASPFCLKVETFLRMAEIKYENVDHKMKYKSKKGQLPFVELNGKEIADSDIIIREVSQHFGKDLDDGLTDEQRIISHAFESMLNNHTSWVVRWWRFNNPGEFLKAAQLDIKKTLNSRLPKGLLNFLFKIGFKSNVKQAVGHGLGRHSTEEIYDFGKSDLSALSKQLGDKEYFFGKEPHLLDCVAFAHLCQFIYVPFAGMKEWMEENTPNLCQLVNRMKERYWPDWDEACNSLELNTHLPKPPKTDEEKKEEELKKEKEEEEKKKKEEKKRQKEEQKREKEEKKKKEKEERERKKREEKEKAEQEKAEKEAAEKKKEEEKKEEKETEKETEKKEADSKEETGGAEAKSEESKETTEEAKKL